MLNDLYVRVYALLLCAGGQPICSHVENEYLLEPYTRYFDPHTPQ